MMNKRLLQNWFVSPPHLLFSTVVMFGICICIPLLMIVVLRELELGPFSLVLFTLFVPIIFIPSVIIFTRVLKRLLLHYRYIKPRSEREQVQNETLRQRLSLYLDTSSFGVIWMVTQIAITVLACVFFVIETYRDYPWMYGAEFIFSVFFTIDYLLFFYCSPDRLSYFFSFYAMIDFVTVYPVFASLFFSGLRSGSSFLRALRVLRSLRILRAYRLLNFSHSGLQQQFIVVFFSIFSLIFCSTAIMQFVETYDSHLGEANPFFYFHDSLYFIVVTFATVGFGEMTPVSFLGRMILVLLILLSMFLIPYQSYKLIQLLTKQSEYSGTIPFNNNGPKHIVVLGDISSHRILHLFRELFHKDQNYRNIRVVILSQHEPAPDTKKLLWHPFYKSRIIYLVGSSLVKKDLKRVALSKAKACLVLTNQYSDNPKTDDSLTQLRLLAIKDFAPDVYTCVQVNRPGLRHTSSDLFNTSTIVTDDLKLSIMARNCAAPGFSTLLSNLLSTYSTADLHKQWNNTWREEYHYGCSHEIYSVMIPVSMQGMTFIEAVRVLYQEYRIVLFAIHKTSSPQEPILNPGSLYTLTSGELGYMISLSRKESQKINHHNAHDYRAPEGFIELQSLPASDTEGWETHERGLSFDSMNSEKQTFIQFEQPRSVTESLLYDNENLGEWEAVISRHGKECKSQENLILSPTEQLDDHIIVYGNITNLVSFIAPLRISTNVEERSVLIIHPNPIPDDVWRIIGRFEGIYLFRGTPEPPIAQEICGFSRAKAFVLLSSIVSRDNFEILPDTETILLYRQIKSSFPDLPIVAELSSTDNVRFIKPGLGSVYERHNSLTGLSNLSVSGRLLHPEYHYNPYFASGSVFSSSLADSLICHLIGNRNLLKLIELMSLGGSSANQILQSSHIYQISVPVALRGAEYREVFDYYSKENIIAVGLYRGAGTKGSDESYVFTNPPPDAIVQPTDSLFILSPHHQMVSYSEKNELVL